MNCPKCNKKNSDDSIFCIYCGKELKLKEEAKEIIAKENKTNRPRLNPLALAGFIVSMASASTGVFGIAGIVGIVLSSIGLSQIKKNNERGRGFAIAGLIVGILAIIIGIFRIIFSLITLIFD